MLGINRTSVELKLYTVKANYLTLDSINRTSVELKPGKTHGRPQTQISINRTSVELKLLWMPLQMGCIIVLIAPVWN